MSDRRKGDRRDSERREFRELEGRRDPDSSPRRLGARRYLMPSMIVVLSVLLLLVYRVVVVAPHARALAVVEETRTQLGPLMSSARLPLLALPGLAEPGPGPLAVDQPLLDPLQRPLVEGIIARLERSTEDSPGLVQLHSLVASSWLLLGRDRDARMSYEQVLALGGDTQRQHAALALGVLALRNSLRQNSAQDRSFAFEHALSYFEGVVEEAEERVLLDGLVNQSVALVLLGRMESADSVLAMLPNLSGGRERQTTLRLWVATGAAVSLLMPSEVLPTINAQGIP